MIGKDAEVEELAAQGAGASAETLPGCRSRRRPRPTCPASSSSGEALSLAVDQVERGVPGLDPAQRAGLPFGLGADRRPLGRVDQVGPRQDDHVRRAAASATGSRSRPRGNRSTQAERLEGIDQHQVEVARQPPMLEAVVEHEQLGLELVDGDPAERDAIGVLEMGDVGQVLLQDPALVVRAPRLARSPGSGSRPACPGGETSGPPTRPSASCRCRPASGCRPRRPARRRDGSASQPRSKPRLRTATAAPYTTDASAQARSAPAAARTRGPGRGSGGDTRPGRIGSSTRLPSRE